MANTENTEHLTTLAASVEAASLPSKRMVPAVSTSMTSSPLSCTSSQKVVCVPCEATDFSFPVLSLLQRARGMNHPHPPISLQRLMLPNVHEAVFAMTSDLFEAQDSNKHRVTTPTASDAPSDMDGGCDAAAAAVASSRLSSSLYQTRWQSLQADVQAAAAYAKVMHRAGHVLHAFRRYQSLEPWEQDGPSGRLLPSALTTAVKAGDTSLRGGLGRADMPSPSAPSVGDGAQLIMTVGNTSSSPSASPAAATVQRFRLRTHPEAFNRCAATTPIDVKALELSKRRARELLFYNAKAQTTHAFTDPRPLQTALPESCPTTASPVYQESRIETTRTSAKGPTQQPCCSAGVAEAKLQPSTSQGLGFRHADAEGEEKADGLSSANGKTDGEDAGKGAPLPPSNSTPSKIDAAKAMTEEEVATATEEARRALSLLTRVRAMRRQTEELTVALLHACGEWGCWSTPSTDLPPSSNALARARAATGSPSWGSTSACPCRPSARRGGDDAAVAARAAPPHLFADLFLTLPSDASQTQLQPAPFREGKETRLGDVGAAAVDRWLPAIAAAMDVVRRREHACSALRIAVAEQQQRLQPALSASFLAASTAFLKLATSSPYKVVPPALPTSLLLDVYRMQQCAWPSAAPPAATSPLAALQRRLRSLRLQRRELQDKYDLLCEATSRHGGGASPPVCVSPAAAPLAASPPPPVSTALLQRAALEDNADGGGQAVGSFSVKAKSISVAAAVSTTAAPALSLASDAACSTSPSSMASPPLASMEVAVVRAAVEGPGQQVGQSDLPQAQLGDTTSQALSVHLATTTTVGAAGRPPSTAAAIHSEEVVRGATMDEKRVAPPVTMTTTASSVITPPCRRKVAPTKQPAANEGNRDAVSSSARKQMTNVISGLPLPSSSSESDLVSTPHECCARGVEVASTASADPTSDPDTSRHRGKDVAVMTPSYICEATWQPHMLELLCTRPDMNQMEAEMGMGRAQSDTALPFPPSHNGNRGTAAAVDATNQLQVAKDAEQYLSNTLSAQVRQQLVKWLTEQQQRHQAGKKAYADRSPALTSAELRAAVGWLHSTLPRDSARSRRSSESAGETAVVSVPPPPPRAITVALQRLFPHSLVAPSPKVLSGVEEVTTEPSAAASEERRKAEKSEVTDAMIDGVPSLAPLLSSADVATSSHPPSETLPMVDEASTTVVPVSPKQQKQRLSTGNTVSQYERHSIVDISTVAAATLVTSARPDVATLTRAASAASSMRRRGSQSTPSEAATRPPPLLNGSTDGATSTVSRLSPGSGGGLQHRPTAVPPRQRRNRLLQRLLFCSTSSTAGAVRKRGE